MIDTPIISLKRDRGIMRVGVQRLGLLLVGRSLRIIGGNEGPSVELSNHEARMLWAIMLRARGEVLLHELVELIWDDPDQEPDYAYSAINVLKSRLNSKLAELGFTLKVRWGWGYMLLQSA